MGFKRPLVQIQSLGPSKQGYRKVTLFVCLGHMDRTPAAFCNTINGRWFKSSRSDNKLYNGNRPEIGPKTALTGMMIGIKERTK